MPMSFHEAQTHEQEDWLARLIARYRQAGVCAGVARAVIVAIDGSTRRQVGASLVVDAAGVQGTLGGGVIEKLAIAAARGHLAMPAASAGLWRRELISVPQGPILGAPARGALHVLVEVFGEAEVACLDAMRAEARTAQGSRARMLLARPLCRGPAPLAIVASEDHASLPEPLSALASRLMAVPDLMLAVSATPAMADAWMVERLVPALVAFHIHGTGEIALALARVLAGTPFAPVVHDPAAGLADDVTGAQGAYHAVLTGVHEGDVEVCRRLLAADRFGYLGMIGSRLKRAGLMARLAALGIAPEVAQRVVCPIGLAAVRGKEPAVIAIAIAAEAIACLRA